MKIRNAMLALCGAALAIGLAAAPASAASALQCKLAGEHLSSGHCCPTGDHWIGQGRQGACCAANQAWSPTQGCVTPAAGFGLSIGIEDPREPNFRLRTCKALHTC